MFVDLTKLILEVRCAQCDRAMMSTPALLYGDPHPNVLDIRVDMGRTCCGARLLRLVVSEAGS